MFFQSLWEPVTIRRRLCEAVLLTEFGGGAGHGHGVLGREHELLRDLSELLLLTFDGLLQRTVLVEQLLLELDLGRQQVHGLLLWR